LAKPVHILHLEDSSEDAELIRRELQRSALFFTITVVGTKQDFLKQLTETQPDLVLSDHSLPGFDSLDALQLVRQQQHYIPFILLTGAVSEEYAVQCMKAGVDDYILKSNLIRLPVSIRSVLSKSKILIEKETLGTLYRQVEEANAEIARKNKEYTDSINYARRIQHSMLPTREQVKGNFQDSFLIFQPKDGLSGDFYWLTRRNSRRFIAIADCTGHGVPGALMSMLGFGLLNENINVKGLEDPGFVLGRINTNIQYVLKQNAKRTEPEMANDGIDIALCVINFSKMQVEFAGANRPLILFRNGHPTIIRGSRYGLGGNQIEQQRDFPVHRIRVEKNDTIYMYTDGCTDQFGEQTDKKFTTKRFLSFLASVQSLSMQEQEEQLRRKFSEWQGDREQTDDRLLMGIRF
jgi:serine phosphatase RsbU (regulator of sigma subunit)/CheY-like chemotaxis protein